MGRPPKFPSDVIVDRAADLFWRQGYGATTPDNLVDELGIGKGSLYRSFESKHNLFVLALRRYNEQRQHLLAEVLGGPGAVRPRLRAAVESLAGIGEHHRGCLIINSTAERAQEDVAVTQVAEDLFSTIERMFCDAIRRGQLAGEFDRTRDPNEMASGLLATLIGVSVLSKSTRSAQRMARIVNGVIDVL
jgi:TetR/AcrR family transcriptional regulator, transcriptional repressor for nem operon